MNVEQCRKALRERGVKVYVGTQLFPGDLTYVRVPASVVLAELVGVPRMSEIHMGEVQPDGSVWIA